MLTTTIQFTNNPPSRHTPHNADHNDRHPTPPPTTTHTQQTMTDKNNSAEREPDSVLANPNTQPHKTGTHPTRPTPAEHEHPNPHTPHTPNPTGPGTQDTRKPTMRLPRKEVIQPHLPVRLPCYDFVPIANPTFDHSPHRNGWAMGFGCYQLS